jgi:hypothetical protein
VVAMKVVRAFSENGISVSDRNTRIAEGGKKRGADEREGPDPPITSTPLRKRVCTWIAFCTSVTTSGSRCSYT